MTVTSYRSALSVGDDGFASTVRSEWTKFRTVRGWVVGLVAGALVTVLVSLLAATGSGRPCRGTSCQGPIGPDGEGVSDSYFFAHQALTGDGSIIARVTSLKTAADTALEQWAKAGVMVKSSPTQGSPYAAVMQTGSHGVRMQWNYLHDKAGGPGSWLRLTRKGTTLTGSVSTDGSHWSDVSTTPVAGLPPTVEIGLFVTSPDHIETSEHFGGSSAVGGPSLATASFDHVALQGATGAWSGAQVGGENDPSTGRYAQAAGVFSLTGSGDIAPATAGLGTYTVERNLVGAFAGLMVMIVLGTMFVTAEYRRGLIRTTLTANPHRGRVLAAKAVVLGGLTFAASLVACSVAFWVVGALRRGKGAYPLPVSTLTEVRVVIGTAALLAVTAVLALAVGVILRRSSGAVTAVVVLSVLPYILGVASVLPSGPANWLLRLTPAAGFAVQQSIPAFHQVATLYAPSQGYFPLSPLVGLGVLCLWAAGGLGLATVLLRRRDA